MKALVLLLVLPVLIGFASEMIFRDAKRASFAAALGSGIVVVLGVIVLDPARNLELGRRAAGVAAADGPGRGHRAVLLRTAADAQADPRPWRVKHVERKAPHVVLATDRLILRRFTVADDPFIFELLNDPAWLEFIGDKGVRTLDAARDYLRKGPIAMYERHGFGLYLVELKAGHIPIGMCGLIKRDSLVDVDIGFALLPAYRTQGYAHESAAAVLVHGQRDFGLKRIVAIASPGNAKSTVLLEKLGMKAEKTVKLDGHDHDVVLYATAC